jgi:hypothetical protein
MEGSRAREGLLAGTFAAMLSAAVLLGAGRRQGAPAAPVNAISHWYWGDDAFHRDRPSLRHTLMGYLTHHGASIFWGLLHAYGWRQVAGGQAPPLLAQAAATSAVAYVVDYHCTPHRFQPGYEQRMSRTGLAGVYVAFAVGLALGSALIRRR